MVQRELKFSVIVPFYNSSEYINRCLEGILSNGAVGEVIVVNDFSDSHHTDLLHSIADALELVKVIDLPVNSGAGVARNVGIDSAKYQYIAFCDSDDFWHENKLDMQLPFLEQGWDIVICGYNRVNEDGILFSKVEPRETLTYDKLLSYCDIGTSTLVIRSEIIRKYKFNSRRTRQDYLLWLALTKDRFTIFSIQKCLVDYLVRSDSISSNKLKAAKSHWQVLKLQNIPIYLKFIYFSKYAFRGTVIHILNRNYGN